MDVRGELTFPTFGGGAVRTAYWLFKGAGHGAKEVHARQLRLDVHSQWLDAGIYQQRLLLDRPGHHRVWDVLILDGIMPAARLRSRKLRLGLPALTPAVSIFNFILVGRYYSESGLPFYCLFAGIFALYIAMQQWGTIHRPGRM